MSAKAVSLAAKALKIKHSLGARCSAGFLRNRGVSLDDALRIVAGRGL